ncbi:hypothetical protein AX13_05060 [Comamonas aquatica DA1877]|uniref:Uncharacterized protein n=1 Tax=Comamonas aquatica DA1877 TaxID=1457173 RepID=A0A014Q8H0_9BURK|nr:hypothetical protein AX13_05060 [Comamonas aquatica DA1877]
MMDLLFLQGADRFKSKFPMLWVFAQKVWLDMKDLA